MIDEGDSAADLACMSPVQQLAAVSEGAHAFVADLYRLVHDELLPALVETRIRLLMLTELDQARRASIGAFFTDAVLPVLTPLAIDVERPFPLLSSLSLNVAVLFDGEPGGASHRLGIVQLPAGLTRLTRISEPDGVSFVLLEDIIRAHLSQLFPGQPILEAAVIRLARDAEMEFDDEGGRTHLELVERELRRRRRSDVVRLEIEASASSELIDMIYCFLNGGDEEIYLASADWMTRNLDKRIELMFPIEDSQHKAKVLSALRAMFRDTIKSRWLGADGTYTRRHPSAREQPFRVQHALQHEVRRSSRARDGVGVTFHPEQRGGARG